MAASTLTSKGQITVPKEVRERLGVREGDRIVFQFDQHGQVVLRPEGRDPLGGLVGLLRHRAKDRPATVEEMNEAIRTRIAKKFAGGETS
jgi:AbrB family looped-hinge helix DNA binding protein